MKVGQIYNFNELIDSNFLVSRNLQKWFYSYLSWRKLYSSVHGKCCCDKEFSTIWSLWGKMCLSFCNSSRMIIQDHKMRVLGDAWNAIRHCPWNMRVSRAEFPLKVLAHLCIVCVIFLFYFFGGIACACDLKHHIQSEN